MRIKEVDREHRYWIPIAILLTLTVIGFFWAIKYISYDRPRKIEEVEMIEGFNRSVENTRGDTTFSEKKEQLEIYIESEETFNIGTKEENLFNENWSVSGDNYADAHYFKLSTNKDQTLRIIRRIKDDKIIFNRWIDNDELRLWKKFDKLQEGLAENPQLNSDIIKLKSDNPQLSN